MTTPDRSLVSLTPPASRRPALRAQGLVEFVLVLPILLFAIFMLIDLSRAAYDFIVLTNAVREAARIGVAQCVTVLAVDPTCLTESMVCVSRAPGCVEAEVLKRAYGVVPQPDSEQIIVSTPWMVINDRLEYELVVQVTYTYSPITPFLGEFLDGNVITVNTSSNMQIE